MGHNGDRTVIQISRYGMGDADEELRIVLARKYLELLAEVEILPESIFFFADGVKLVVEGSPVLGELRALEEKGVRLVACSTCLGHFGLTEKVAAGVAGGMAGLIEAQFGAAKVISI